MLTEKHRAILSQLRHDARMSLAAISRRTGIPTSTVFDHYQELKGSVILRHAALPDFTRLGYPLRKRFLVKAKERGETLAWLKRHPAVNNLYRVDAYDAFFEAYFKDAAELETFREELRRGVKIRNLKEHDILEELKHEAFVPER